MMSLDEILKTAIRIEGDGIAFYKKAADDVKDQNGRDTLLFLANEEKRHMEFFEGMLKTHGSGSAETAKALELPRIFPEKHGHGEGGEADTNMRILIQARDIEEKSIEFYTTALGSTGEQTLRSGLERIISEEKQHLEWIGYLLDSVEAHGYWSDLESHFSLDGG